MKRVTVLVAEDEAPQRETLVALLAELWPACAVVAACSDGLQALEALEREQPQVAFLDIRMPGVSGLEVAAAAAGRTHLVFVTAHDDYAVRAFEQGAVDYLLKPVRRDRLAATVERLQSRLGGAPPPDLEALLARLRAELAVAPRPATLRWITASAGDTVRLYPIDEVLAFQAQDKYTRVLTAADEAIIRKSLRELQGELDSEIFWQVHRSVIVRASAIDRVKRDALGKHWLTLKHRADVLPVSSAFHHRFRGM
jgi:DNA-binding LytR/AlgR family response regulator